MEMRIVESVGRAHGADLLAASHCLAASHKNLVQMPVKRVDVANSATFAIRMPNDDNIPPPLMAVAREHNHTITNSVDRVAKVCVSTADSVPVLPEMSV